MLFLGMAIAFIKGKSNLPVHPGSEFVERMEAAMNQHRFWNSDCSRREKDQSLIILSRKGLLELLQFLLLSGCAFAIRDFNLFASFSEQIKVFLGCPPPAVLTNIALTIYCIAVMIPQCICLASGSRPIRTHNHLAYLLTFYLFYFISNALAANFAGVLAVGLILYGLGQLSIWAYACRPLEDGNPAV